MKQKNILLLDFDQLLIETSLPEIEYLDWKYDITLTLAEFRSTTDHFDLIKNKSEKNGYIGLDWATFHDSKTREFLMSEKWQYKAPLIHQDIPNILQEASQIYEIHITTSRDSRAGTITVLTCKKHAIARYIDAYHYCHCFIGNKSWNKTSKAQYAQRLEKHGRKVSFFFDDQEKEIKEMRELMPDIQSYLFDEHGKSDDPQKVTSWSEIADLIL